MQKKIFGLGAAALLAFALALSGCKDDAGPPAGETYTGTVTIISGPGAGTHNATLTVSGTNWSMSIPSLGADGEMSGTLNMTSDYAGSILIEGATVGTVQIAGNNVVITITSGDGAGTTGQFTKS
jgi:hypothetical protein